MSTIGIGFVIPLSSRVTSIQNIDYVACNFRLIRTCVITIVNNSMSIAYIATSNSIYTFCFLMNRGSNGTTSSWCTISNIQSLNRVWGTCAWCISIRSYNLVLSRGKATNHYQEAEQKNAFHFFEKSVGTISLVILFGRCNVQSGRGREKKTIVLLSYNSNSVEKGRQLCKRR